MPRVVDAVDDGGVGLEVRAFLIRQAEEAITASLSRPGTDVYDFSAERDGQLDRLTDLRAGHPVTVYGWQFPRHLQPRDRAAVYEVTGGGIALAVYERADGTVR